MPRGGDSLGQPFARVAFVEEHLPLKIAPLYEIAIDDAKRADARAHQQIRQYSSQRPASGQNHSRLAQAPLPSFAQRREPDLTRIPLHSPMVTRGSPLPYGRGSVLSARHRLAEASTEPRP